MPTNPRVLLCVHGLTRMGRDFDRLARAMAPDVGWSVRMSSAAGTRDRLRDPELLRDSAVRGRHGDADRAPRRRTSRLGRHLDGRADRHRARGPGRTRRSGDWCINDVGPRLDAAAIARIGTLCRATDLVRAASKRRSTIISTIAAPFGLKTRDDWRELVAPTIQQDGGRWVLRYDPAIAVPFKAVTPQSLRAAEAVMWALYDHITAANAGAARCEVRPAVARDVRRDGRAGTACPDEGDRRRRSRADADACQRDRDRARLPSGIGNQGRDGSQRFNLHHAAEQRNEHG